MKEMLRNKDADAQRAVDVAGSTARAENNVETGRPHAPDSCGYAVGLSAAEEDSIFEAPITCAWFEWKGS